MNKPAVSIIIPTYWASSNIVEPTLESIVSQTCPKNFYEIIMADNNGGAAIRSLAGRYEAKILDIKGKPPQTCNQVNQGAKYAKGSYIFILDHDITLSPNFLKEFGKLANIKKDIDAWFVPYKISARGYILNKARNFEEKFYKDSVIAAARIIKKDVFFRTEDQYDPELNAGPGDWDLTNQLKMIGAKFGYINNYVLHHEEHLDFLSFLSKKRIYAQGAEIYKKKWYNKNPKIYNEVVKKQFDPLYRLFVIFIENGEWKILIPNLHLYLLFLFIKVSMSLIYTLRLFKNP